MAVININSGGPEGKEREFGLTWSSDLPSVRKPYTRKAHIPEDDVVFGDAKPSGGDGRIDMTFTDQGTVLIGDSIFAFHFGQNEVVAPSDMGLDISGLNNVYVYVPADLVDSYKENEEWAPYADHVFPEPEEEETQEETPGEP